MSTLMAAVTGPALTGQTRVVAGVIGALMLAFVLELVRRRKLQERYIVLWVLASAAITTTAAFPVTTSWMTQALGVRAAFAGMIGLLFLLLFVFALHTTVAISRLSEQNTRLAQELAVQRAGEQRDADDVSA